jgi:Domain of unknown function (DUF4440)
MTEQTDAFLTAWTTAEQAGDVRTLDQLLTAGFYGVGPMGFMLPKMAWLARHQAGGLAYTHFGLDQVQAVRYGEVTVVTARHTSAGTYQDRPVPEAARATLVIVSEGGTRKLAVIHLSFMAGTSGAPPLPGAAPPTGPDAPQ